MKPLDVLGGRRRARRSWPYGRSATAAYFTFRDDLLTRLIARQAEMQYAYEDRITDLRGQVDRLTSRQLLDQEQFEYKLDQIVRRQAALESRATALSGVPDPAAGQSRPSLRYRPHRPRYAPSPPKPSPINDTPNILAAARPRRRASAARAVARREPSGRQEKRRRDRSRAVRPANIARSRGGRVRRRLLNGLAETYDFRARRLRGMLADLGVDLTKVPPPRRRQPAAPSCR